MKSDLEHFRQIIDKCNPCRYTGKVTKVTGFMIESMGPQAMVGELCKIYVPGKEKPVQAEVVAIDGSKVHLITYESALGIQMGCHVMATGRNLGMPMSNSLLGRVIDSMGNPLDGKGPIGFGKKRSVFGNPPDILNRQMVQAPVETGVRSIDSLLTVGLGQRLGIFSPAGTGKTTLLKAITGIHEYDSGRVLIDGIDLKEDPKANPKANRRGTDSAEREKKRNRPWTSSWTIPSAGKTWPSTWRTRTPPRTWASPPGR